MNKEDREELKELMALILKPIDDLLQEHHRTLFGSGSDDHQGLRVDVHDLKEERKSRDRHFWVLYPTVIGVSLKAIWDLFTTKNN